MATQANRFALAVMVLVAVGGRASANTTPPPPTAAEEAEARRLFAEGTKSFALAEYEGAVRYYRAAYKIVPQPLFLYDIGQAYRLAKDYEKAKGFYESFLLNLPDAPIRAEVETLIEQMDAAIASQPKPAPHARVPSPVEVARLSPAAAAPRPLPRPPSDNGRRPIYKKWWFWAGVGAVAVGATVVVVAGSAGGSGAPTSGLGTSRVFN